MRKLSGVPPLNLATVRCVSSLGEHAILIKRRRGGALLPRQLTVTVLALVCSACGPAPSNHQQGEGTISVVEAGAAPIRDTAGPGMAASVDRISSVARPVRSASNPDASKTAPASSYPNNVPDLNGPVPRRVPLIGTEGQQPVTGPTEAEWAAVAQQQ